MKRLLLYGGVILAIVFLHKAGRIDLSFMEFDITLAEASDTEGNRIEQATTHISLPVERVSDPTRPHDDIVEHEEDLIVNLPVFQEHEILDSIDQDGVFEANLMMVQTGVAAGYLTLRESDSADSLPLAYIKEGTLVEFSGWNETLTWAHVKTPDGEGWVNVQFTIAVETQSNQ